jgi:hypothetical protein
MRRLAIVAFALAGCGHQPRTEIVAARAAGGDADEVTLYRDGALVVQHVGVDLDKTGVATIAVRVAAGIGADDVVVFDHVGLEVTGLHGPGPKLAPAPAPAPEPEPEPESEAEAGSGTSAPGTAPHPTPSDTSADSGAVIAAMPDELHIDVAGPPGHHTLTIGYGTDKLRWDAAYTMTATPARDRVVLRGALAIRNSTGVDYRASTQVVDADLGTWRARAGDKLATELVGSTPGTAPATIARELGDLTISQGETRIELLADPRPRPMRSVLVYDPVGTRLDNPSTQPLRDPIVGSEPGTPRITESFEVERDEHATVGLPAGPVRLLERRGDGSLALLGETRLFDASTRVADVDTIAVGTAEGVTGQRERRELSVDQASGRIVEEIEITIDNQRPAPVAVLMREHMYRGQNWTLAFYSVASAAKEGPQQIALRTRVPARTRQKFLYVVVYKWR